MTLSQNKGKVGLKVIMYLIVLIIAITYYDHLTNQNPSLGIADKNFVFLATSWFEIALLIFATTYFSKDRYDQNQRETIADRFGIVALAALFGGLGFFGIFWIGMPPTWMSDLLIQIIAISAMGCIIIMPTKGDQALPLSMIFPLIGTCVYLCDRF